MTTSISTPGPGAVLIHTSITCSGESYRGSSRTGSWSIKNSAGKVVLSGTFTKGAPANTTTQLISGVGGNVGCGTGTYTITVNYDPSDWNLTNTVTYTTNHYFSETGNLRSSATCTAAATYWYKCRCGAQGSTYFSSGSALGHGDLVTGALRSAATCTAAATYWLNCGRCGAQASYFSSGNPTGHNNTATGAVRTNATCTSPATYWYKCATCGTQSSNYFYSGSPLGHTTPADYTYETSNGIAQGRRYKKCSVCGSTTVDEYKVALTAGTGIAKTMIGANVSTLSWLSTGSRPSITGIPSTGYKWSRWSDETSGTTVGSVRTLTMNQAYQFTAYGTPITYTVTYNGNGATGGTMAASTHTYNTAQTLTPNTFVKAGARFVGWSKTETGSVAYTDKQSVSNLTTTNNGNVNLYAVWEENADIYFGQDGKWKTAMLYYGQNGKWKEVSLSFGQNGAWKHAGT